MDKGTYYCVITQGRSDIEPGVYCFSKARMVFANRHYQLSQKVWLQGPRGGVKLTKNKSGYVNYQYITNKPEYMKEFMWAKLKAQTVK